MGDRSGQRVGSVGRVDTACRKQSPNHRLNLFLGGVADTNDGFLDVVRRIFRDLETRLSGGKQRDRTRMTKFQGGRRVAMDKGLLDCDGARPRRLDDALELAVNKVESRA